MIGNLLRKNILLIVLSALLCGCSGTESKYRKTATGDLESSSETKNSPVHLGNSSSSSYAGPDGANASQATGR
ncbi:MAG: hypothetical protein D3917_02845 [Candidatus Electrothrix sp. AX5]|nr:hypothetical protein [Candidatus Electrothrix sp. AX5]